jgi:hypothetical protein
MAGDARQGRVDFAGALRYAARTALIAFGVLLPLVGFQTVTNINDVLTLRTRWPLLLAIVAITFVCCLLYSTAIAPWATRRAQRPAQAAPPLWRLYLNNWGIPFAIAAAIAYPLVIYFTIGIHGGQKWIDTFGVQILIYVMLGWGLNIVVGLAGLLDLGYVAFYAVGAYSYALLAKTFALVVLGHPARLPGITAARRLPRYRHAGFRRDHSAHPDQLGGPDQRLRRDHQHSAADVLRPCFHRIQYRFRGAFRFAVLTAPSHHLSLLRDPGAGAADLLRHGAVAAPADRPRLGSLA